MKRLFLILVISCVSIAHASAQQAHNRKEKEAEFQKIKIEMIVQRLELSPSVAEQFTEIYTQYNEDKIILRKSNKRPKGKPEEMTDEQIEQLVLASFSMATKTTELKQTYFYKFKSVLTASQIFKMYDIERQINKDLNAELQNRTGAQGRKGGMGGKGHNHDEQRR